MIYKSEGKRLFCGKTYTKTSINRYLQTHLTQKVNENASGQSYLIKEANPKWGSEPYFLSLWVDSSATNKLFYSHVTNRWNFCVIHAKRNATQLCTVHNWNNDRIFCNKCAKKHAKKCLEFSDYADMPVVNSPRMGVRGYTGGSPDKERYGVFVKKS
jgi:hypothetical protein